MLSHSERAMLLEQQFESGNQTPDLFKVIKLNVSYNQDKTQMFKDMRGQCIYV